MAWPTQYRSRYRPSVSGMGWSTRHLIAEQTDSIVEIVERKRRESLDAKFERFMESSTGERRSFESTSTLSLQLDEYDPSGESKSKKAQCDSSCYLKERLPERQPLAVPASLSVSPIVLDTARIYSKMDRGHFRMLLLLKDLPSAPIKCVLAEDISLGLLLDEQNAHENLPRSRFGYEALSYVWGPKTPSSAIQVANSEKPEAFVTLNVTRSLHSALHHLRRVDHHRLLWVDAICINQDDTADKNEQVRHMMKIYANADRVVIWLGEEAENSRYAMRWMNLFHGPEVRQQIFSLTHQEECTKYLLKTWNALTQLYDRPWFTRVWIWQEVMVAKEVIVWCGQDHTSWNALKKASKGLSRIQKLIPDNERANLRPMPLQKIAFWKCLKRGWIYGTSIRGLSSERNSVYEMQAGGILDLLMVSRSLRATDQRDKVYAFLGVGRVPVQMEEAELDKAASSVTRMAPSVPVDYDLSIPQTYQNITKYMVNKYRSLDALCILNNFPSTTPDVPSWTPDWRDDETTTQRRLHEYFDYLSLNIAAAGDSIAELQDSSHYGILQVQGYPITEINAVLDWSTGISGDSRNQQGLERGFRCA